MRRFTSKSAAPLATDSITIGGCPDRPPVISGFDLSSSPVKPAKGATMSFDLDEAADVTVTIVKKGTSKALQTFKVKGRADKTNRVKGFGKGLAAGRYQAVVKATDPGGKARTKKFDFRVKK